MKRELAVWFLELGTGWRRMLSPHRNLKRAQSAANALLIRRPDIDQIEVRDGGRVLWRTTRADWQGWL